MEDMSVYVVGRPFDRQRRRWPEGVMYVYQSNWHRLLIFFKGIRSGERQAVQRGLTHFGLYVEEDVIFLLFKMDGASGKGIAWHAAPYSWHLVDPEARTLPEPPQDIPEGMGALVHIFLIEASTGIIEAIRVVNFSHDFTERFALRLRPPLTESATTSRSSGSITNSPRLTRWQRWPRPDVSVASMKGHHAEIRDAMHP
jgi:hypothetical protein